MSEIRILRRLARRARNAHGKLLDLAAAVDAVGQSTPQAILMRAAHDLFTVTGMLFSLGDEARSARGKKRRTHILFLGPLGYNGALQQRTCDVCAGLKIKGVTCRICQGLGTYWEPKA